MCFQKEIITLGNLEQLIDKNKSDDEALLIHEQLMEQYTEAFKKLAQ